MHIGDKKIVMAEQGDKAELALFWKEIFDDEDAFIRLFFDHVYNPDNTLVIREKDEILAALHLVPYQVKIENRICNAAYICGVGTRKSARDQGFMNMLMDAALKIIKNRGYDLSFLIPAEDWLFDVYGKMGFTCKIGNEDREINPVSSNKNSQIIPCNLEHYPYFDKKQQERQNTVLHDLKDFSVILQDLKIEDGGAFLALTGNVPAGMIFAKPAENKTVLITDILSDNEQLRDALIAYVRDRFEARRSVFAFPRGLACLFNEDIKNIPSLYLSLMLD